MLSYIREKEKRPKMKNKIADFLRNFFVKLRKEFFSKSSNIVEKILFNVTIVTLFISIFLTMGFTRVYPLNIILKWVLLVTNILIIGYIIFFSKIKIERYTVIIIAGLIWFALMSLINGAFDRDRSFLLNIFNMIPLYLFISSSSAARKTTFAGVLFGLIAYTLSFIVYYARDLMSFDLSVRLGTFFGNQNDVAFTLVMASIIFLFYVFKRKYIFVPLVLLSFLALLSTGSRAGFLVALVVGLAMFVFMFYKKNKKLVIGGVVALVIIVIVTLSLPVMKPLTEKLGDMVKTLLFGSGAGADTDGSTLSRMNLLVDALQLFLYSPMFGGAISTISFSEKAFVAHNAYAELLARQGLISFLFFLFLFIYPVIKIIKNRRRKMYMYVFVILGLMAFLLTLSGLTFKEQYTFLALAAATLNETVFVEISPRKEALLFLIRIKALLLTSKNLSTDFAPQILGSKKGLIIIDQTLENDYQKTYNDLKNQNIDFYLISCDGKIMLIENDLNISTNSELNDEGLMEIYKTLKHSTKKIVLFANKDNFKHQFLSIKFYEKLFLIRQNKVVWEGRATSNLELSSNEEKATTKIKKPKAQKSAVVLSAIATKKIDKKDMILNSAFVIFLSLQGTLAFSFSFYNSKPQLLNSAIEIANKEQIKNIDPYVSFLDIGTNDNYSSAILRQSEEKEEFKTLNPYIKLDAHSFSYAGKSFNPAGITAKDLTSNGTLLNGIDLPVVLKNYSLEPLNGADYAVMITTKTAISLLDDGVADILSLIGKTFTDSNSEAYSINNIVYNDEVSMTSDIYKNAYNSKLTLLSEHLTHFNNDYIIYITAPLDLLKTFKYSFAYYPEGQELIDYINKNYKNYGANDNKDKILEFTILNENGEYVLSENYSNINGVYITYGYGTNEIYQILLTIISVILYIINFAIIFDISKKYRNSWFIYIALLISLVLSFSPLILIRLFSSVLQIHVLANNAVFVYSAIFTSSLLILLLVQGIIHRIRMKKNETK